MDNLFSSPSLYRILRDRGIGATGTARVNSGIHEDLVEFKKADDGGKLKWAWGAYKAIPTKDNKKDNALVLFMTSVFSGAEIEQHKEAAYNNAHTSPGDKEAIWR
ncbi:hypothetical protein H9Q73_013203 [Fusarium xylarioides]|nr:hypothetical protein H9Q73_013203 [Fusarium xylarioides]